MGGAKTWAALRWPSNEAVALLPALRWSSQVRSFGLSVKAKLLLGWVAAILTMDQATKFIVDQTIPLLEAAKDDHETFLAYSYRGCALTCLGRYADGTKDIQKALEDG